MLSKPLCLVLLVLSFSASAVVIRDDVDDAKYRVPDAELPALADIPMEGHGVLIDPRWVVTAAHAVTWQSGGVNEVTINHVPRHVERVVLYPGYQKLPQPLVDKALKTHDATQIIAFLSASNDVALLKLSEPVTDVAPIAIYRKNDELGKTIKIVGQNGVRFTYDRLNYYGLVDVRGEGRRTVGFWLRPWRGSHPGLAPFVVGDSSEWMPGRRRKGFRVAADCRPWRATLA